MQQAHTLKQFKHKVVQSLWHECDALYARDPKGYIALQDSYQLNINLLLLAQWLDNLCIDHQYLNLNSVIWSELNNKVQAHDQDTLIPFRQHRRASKKTLSSGDYQHMLKKELQLERQTQQFILTLLEHILFQSQNIDALLSHSIESNLDNYLSVFKLHRRDCPVLNR
ncbi:DUF2390 domain-containing protein [uncultured Shewanella sp.]|uniref:DUF2390 domain-containing protein n=1 Tax=uncultured Shewanella sp. TaxID=173975 RepID=UPI00261C4261|nr:DUF2390 domain-containing protein [uncultured Shewanella sp.]